MGSMIRLFTEYGLAIVLVAFVCYLLNKFLMHLLNKESKVLDKIADKLDAHEKEAVIRAGYVRREHEQMINTLQRLNGK